MARDADPVGSVTSLKLGVQPVGRLEESDAQRAPVALETVAKRRQRAVRVHPLAQVAEHLPAGPVAKERLELRPFLGLGLADEGQDDLREDRALAVETQRRSGHVAVIEQVGLDDGLEGGLGVYRCSHHYN